LKNGNSRKEPRAAFGLEALILRSAERRVSKDEGASRKHCKSSFETPLRGSSG
jgi:hypothetical protein